MLIEDLNLTCKTDEKTRYYIISFPHDKCLMEAKEIEYGKIS